MGAMALAGRWRWRSGSHGPTALGASSEPRRPPLRCARAGLLMPVARNRSRFFKIAIRFRQNAVKYLHPRNGPFLLKRQVPGRKFVIATADGGFLRCLWKTRPYRSVLAV